MIFFSKQKNKKQAILKNSQNEQIDQSSLTLNILPPETNNPQGNLTGGTIGIPSTELNTTEICRIYCPTWGNLPCLISNGCWDTLINQLMIFGLFILVIFVIVWLKRMGLLGCMFRCMWKCIKASKRKKRGNDGDPRTTRSKPERGYWNICSQKLASLFPCPIQKRFSLYGKFSTQDGRAATFYLKRGDMKQKWLFDRQTSAWQMVSQKATIPSMFSGRKFQLKIGTKAMQISKLPKYWVINQLKNINNT